MNNKKLILSLGGVGIVIIIAAFAYLAFSSHKATGSNPGTPAATITRTDNGFQPDTITIKKGDTVLFNSTAKNFYWPASDIHPTHGIYPEFDPKRPIAPDETWSFKFDRVGTWRFHDHLQANITGAITVTE